MKSAIYIRDGRTQVVLTPESDIEKMALSSVEKGSGSQLQTYRGSFYDCRGGWVRQGPGDESLIFVVTATPED